MEDQELDAYEYFLKSKVDMLKSHLSSLPNEKYPDQKDKDDAGILLIAAELSHQSFMDWRMGKLESIDVRHLIDVNGLSECDAKSLTRDRIKNRMSRTLSLSEQ